MCWSVLEGKGGDLPRRSGGDVRRGEYRCPQRGRRGLPLGSVRRNNIRQQMCGQRYVLFRCPTRKLLVCWGRPNGMPQDGVSTTMVMPKILPAWRHMYDVLIAKLAVRVAMSTSMPPKGGGYDRWGYKPKKYEVSEATKMIRRVWQGVYKIDRKGICYFY